MRKIIPISFILFFLIAFAVSAVPPVSQLSLGSDEWSIAYPKFNQFKLGEIASMHFHVYNTSGYNMKNDTTSCVFHLYDNTGSHILQTEMGFCATNNIDFELDINKSIINKTGRYTYIVGCNDSIRGGFISAEFDIVNNFTEEYTLNQNTQGINDSTQSISIVLFLIFIVGGLISLSFRELAKTEILNLILKRGCLALSLFLMALNSGVIANIALSGGLNISSMMINLYGLIFGWAGYITVLYLVFRTLIDIIKLWSELIDRKRMEL